MSAASFFAEAHASMLEADADFFGAHVGTYTASPAAAVSCRVLLGDGLQQIGEFAQVAASRTVLELSAEDVPAPVPGATVVAGGQTYVLDQLIDRKAGSHSTWVVL